MDVGFPDGVEFSVRPLMEQVPGLLIELQGVRSEDSERLRDLLARLHLRVTGTRTWRCDASTYGIVYISKKTIEILWAFSFAHVSIYKHLLEGKQISGDFDIGGNPALALPRAMLAWCKADATLLGANDIPEDAPVPMPGARADSIEEVAYNIARYAIQFCLFHEMGHVFVGNAIPDIRECERECDRKAAHWMVQLPADSERVVRHRKQGMAVALAYIVAYGLDTGRHDGITHDSTYVRLVDVLEQQCSIRDDCPWSLVTAILAAHATDQGIALNVGAVPDEGFEEFSLAVHAFRDAIQAHDIGR